MATESTNPVATINALGRNIAEPVWQGEYVPKSIQVRGPRNPQTPDVLGPVADLTGFELDMELAFFTGSLTETRQPTLRAAFQNPREVESMSRISIPDARIDAESGKIIFGIDASLWTMPIRVGSNTGVPLFMYDAVLTYPAVPGRTNREKRLFLYTAYLRYGRRGQANART